MWESAGISEPRSLLQDLGFYGAEVQVTELIAALEDEQQRLGDGNDTSVVVRVSAVVVFFSLMFSYYGGWVESGLPTCSARRARN